MFTYAYGFPRLGRQREYKKCIEQFWKDILDEKELLLKLKEIEKERIDIYKKYIDLFPRGELTYYDNILDTAFIFGIYKFKTLKEYYDYARGKHTLELKKYFNTNYHYLVPHITKQTKLKFSWNKPLFYFDTFPSSKDKPVFCIGPYTFLKLSSLTINFEEAFERLSCAYSFLFEKLTSSGLYSLHLEEPAFVLDIPHREIKIIIKNYSKLLETNMNINLITYYEGVSFLHKLYDLPIRSIGLDFISSEENLQLLKKYRFPKDKILICGIINGRNPRRADIIHKAKVISQIMKISRIDESRIGISNSCPLYHLPISINNEEKIGKTVKNNLSFAEEKLYELYLIKKVMHNDTKEAKIWSRDIFFKKIKGRTALFDTLSLRSGDFKVKRKLHNEIFNLPLFPTTTIGSFPQDAHLRKIRFDFRKKRISLREYRRYIYQKIKELVAFQKEIGLDVFVHGEFERSDMVEFFAQKLKGFVTTHNGWVISYGTRVYRPPIIYGPIKRNKPITIDEITYAQKLTSKPVKGIFTGPVTIVAWSYNLRKDPIYKVAFELSKALNEEAKELVKNNINFIQIDEPAIKEFAPLRRKERDFYFSWAVRAFNLTVNLPKIAQVHTHMCYSEFSDIIKWILKMNFDVITIEAARENAKIVNSFKNIKFSRQIGPGVWDIHSKYPANTKTIENIIKKAIKVFGKENIWLNPDCGLKTRGWPEVKLSLKRMVKIAKKFRYE